MFDYSHKITLSKPPLHTAASLQKGVIQRAGHTEDLLIIKGKIIKRIDEIEAKQYQSFRPLLLAGSRYVPNIPWFIGPFNTLEKLKKALTPEEQTKVDAKWEDPEHKHWYIILENVTGGHTASIMRDLKIGTATASYTEQIRSQKKNPLKAGIKAMKHLLLMDTKVSARYGFRDEDAQKKGARGHDTNLKKLKELIGNATLEATEKLLTDVHKVIHWISLAPTVYVGASMLVVVNNDEPLLNRAVMIDFAHPISVELGFKPETVEKYRKGMLKGLFSIASLLSYHKLNHFKNPFLRPLELKGALKPERSSSFSERRKKSGSVSEMKLPAAKPSENVLLASISMDIDSPVDLISVESGTDDPAKRPRTGSKLRPSSWNSSAPVPVPEARSGKKQLLSRATCATIPLTPTPSKDERLLISQINRMKARTIARKNPVTFEKWRRMLQDEVQKNIEAIRTVNPNDRNEQLKKIFLLPENASLHPLRHAIEDYETLEWKEDEYTIQAVFKLLLKLENLISDWLRQNPFSKIIQSKDPAYYLTPVVLQLLNLVQLEQDDALCHLERLNYAFPALDERLEGETQRLWTNIRKKINAHISPKLEKEIRLRILNYCAHLMNSYRGRELLSSFFDRPTPYSFYIQPTVQIQYHKKSIENEDFVLSQDFSEKQTDGLAGEEEQKLSETIKTVYIHTPPFDYMNDTCLMFEGIHETMMEAQKKLFPPDGASAQPSRPIRFDFQETRKHILAQGYIRFARALALAQSILEGRTDLLSMSGSPRSRRNTLLLAERNQEELLDDLETPIREEASLPPRRGTNRFSAFAKGGWFAGRRRKAKTFDDEELIRNGYFPI
ncbi:MAG: inositol polyphosphate kinase family protein [Cytophagales bacterium]|nr:inositol polyphosphate kinase family protein [Cytophagales bacterium]